MSLNLPPNIGAVFARIFARLDSLERRRLPILPELSTRPGPTSVQYNIFGDGSDGTINFDGVTTVLGLVPSGGVYTLTRDLYLADGSQVSGTAQIAEHGFRIFCSGTFTIATGAKVQASGAAPVGFLAGQAGQPGAMGGGSNGGAGGSFNNPGANSAALSNALGGSGGSGGRSAGGAPDAAAVASPPLAAAGGFPRNIWQGMSGGTTQASTSVYQGGTGGRAGGGSSGAGAAGTGGGAGGGGGGVVYLIALILLNNGAIEAKGGAGGNAANAVAGPGAGGAGGGGGGGGGGIVIICGQGSTVGTISVAGGVAGTPLGTGTNGSAGSDGRTFTTAV